MLKRIPGLIFSLLLLPASVLSCHGADSDWDYTQGGQSGVSEQKAGNAGEFRSYYATSDDPAEKVVLWYSERLGLPKNHSLVKAAHHGFSNFENRQVIQSGYGHDTDDRQEHTTMIALLSPEHVHITFLHRLRFNGQEDIAISIASAPNGRTSICVIKPVVKGHRDN